MTRERNWKALAILNVLMNTDGYLTTGQICDRADCDRKAVYSGVDLLEVNGFAIEILQEHSYKNKQNRYRYAGLRGM